MFDRRGELRKDSSSGKPLTKDTLQRDKGCINPEFKHMHMLSSDSKPWEIADAFIPYKHDKMSVDNCFSFTQVTDGQT